MVWSTRKGLEEWLGQQKKDKRDGWVNSKGTRGMVGSTRRDKRDGWVKLKGTRGMVGLTQKGQEGWVVEMEKLVTHRLKKACSIGNLPVWVRDAPCCLQCSD